MTRLASRLADWMLSVVAPRATAKAECVLMWSEYCYCSGHLAYRKYAYDCLTYWWYTGCEVSGTC